MAFLARADELPGMGIVDRCARDQVDESCGRAPHFDEWLTRLASVRYALQPIVNIHTGNCIGYEFLLRGTEDAGFSSIQSFFDTAHLDGVLGDVSLALLDKAVESFKDLEADGRRLFFNLDNRVLEDPAYHSRGVAEVLSNRDLCPNTLCLEVSERHQIQSMQDTMRSLTPHRQRTYSIAIDDFGTGFSGFQLLYYSEPDFIKIDRFFISDISHDARKRLFVASIVGVAHLLGVVVIAEGVETLQEYFICREIGCDLVQGYFVQKPQTDLSQLRLTYPHVGEASRSERRSRKPDQALILSRMEKLAVLQEDADIFKVFELFRNHATNTFYPVVSAAGEPIGIIRESDLREYAYSLYGKELLRNPKGRRSIREWTVKCPIADINLPAERILELFSLADASEGVLLVDGMRYAGFLSTRSLLQVVYEKKLLVARDQNPLTRLPGNTMIYEYLSRSLSQRSSHDAFVYFDFDHFKAFNDAHGFRIGDRAIMLFAEILQKFLLREQTFVGHVGGDDFFAGIKSVDLESLLETLEGLVERFSRDVESLHRRADRERGFYTAKARNGVLGRFPLLSVSAAVLVIPRNADNLTTEVVIATMAELKRTVKRQKQRICAATALTPRRAGEHDWSRSTAIDPRTANSAIVWS